MPVPLTIPVPFTRPVPLTAPLPLTSPLPKTGAAGGILADASAGIDSPLAGTTTGCGGLGTMMGDGVTIDSGSLEKLTPQPEHFIAETGEVAPQLGHSSISSVGFSGIPHLGHFDGLPSRGSAQDGQSVAISGNELAGSSRSR